MTPNPQANTVDEILNYCRVNYAPEAIHDEYEEQVKSRVKALITEARIDELSRQLESSEYAEDRTATDVKERIEATIEQLKENK